MCPNDPTGVRNQGVVKGVLGALRRMGRSVDWRRASVGALRVLGATALVLVITAGLFAGILGILTMFAFNR